MKKTTKKGPGGRPSLYKKEYCEQIVDFMSRGKALVQFATLIGVCRETVYEWGRVHDEFSDALRKAKDACESWWIDESMKNLDNPKFKDAMWKYHMAHRFRWSDKHELEKAVRETIKLAYNIEDKDALQKKET